MAPKVEEDVVIAEYDVYLTPPISGEVFLLQYPNRPRNRPYSAKYGASPHEMRIKPNTGFLEVDVLLNTQHNFNKYMGLKWGDASRVSKEVHNPTGTYGPASGLAFGKARGAGRGRDAKDKADHELELENDLRDFNGAVKNDKVFAKQTLGGQIIRHDDEVSKGKPNYFVGAFKNDQLTLTKITGTCQMRPHFHHLDAEEERVRMSVSRAQADAAGPAPEPVARTVMQRSMDSEDRNTQEYKLRQGLREAERENWVNMNYVDEEDMAAYDEFEKKFKVEDGGRLPILKTEMHERDFLWEISSHRGARHTKKRRGKSKKKGETVDLEGSGGESEVEDDGEEGGDEGQAEDGGE